jgi:hypothetical protein
MREDAATRSHRNVPVKTLMKGQFALDITIQKVIVHRRLVHDDSSLAFRVPCVFARPHA